MLKQSTFFKATTLMAFILAILWTVLPLYIMLKISFSAPAEILQQHPPLLIHSFTLDHWQETLASGNLMPPLIKSLSVAVGATILALLISIPGAYALARLPGQLGLALISLIFISRLLPEVEIALPISISFIRLGLLDTSLGLILAHLIRILPLTTWILLNTFKTIPLELEEAAEIDGAGRLNILRKVALPLALPGIAVAGIFAFLFSWDEFIYALYLSFTHKTLPLMVYYYINRASWFDAATFASIITIPVLIVTFFLQRYLKTEYLAGAVKG
ncbi:MAG: carbohydrate ABC transporter permease [bacterium]